MTMRLSWPKRLSVIVVPEGGARTYNFQMRTVLLIILLGGATILVLVSIASMFAYGRLLTASAEKLRLERQVRLLEVELEKMRSLEVQLQTAEKTRVQVLRLLGAIGRAPDSLTSDVALAVATGGDELRLREEDFLRSVPSTWPVRGPVTRGFARAEAGAALYHPGLDIAAATGTPVRAAATGTVTFSGTDPVYGNLVILDHGLGLESRYGHNERLAVRTGERITRGQLIAAVGSTGRSSAPHLHFEIRKDGVPVDPREYLE